MVRNFIVHLVTAGHIVIVTHPGIGGRLYIIERLCKTQLYPKQIIPSEDKPLESGVVQLNTRVKSAIVSRIDAVVGTVFCLIGE